MDEIGNQNEEIRIDGRSNNRPVSRGNGHSEKRYIEKRRELVEIMYFNWGWAADKIRHQIVLNKDILNLKPSLRGRQLTRATIQKDINYIKEHIFNNMVKDPESKVGGIIETLSMNIMVGYSKRKENLWSIYARCQNITEGHKPDERAAISALEAIRKEEGEVIDNLMNLGKITKQEAIAPMVEVNIYEDGSGPLSQASEADLRELLELAERDINRTSKEESE